MVGPGFFGLGLGLGFSLLAQSFGGFQIKNQAGGFQNSGPYNGPEILLNFF
jgi:hypothetical protein